MDFYEVLKIRKENGENLNFNDISKSELEKLFYGNCSDSVIASLYGISKSEVTSKRYKLGIKFGSKEHYMYKFRKDNSDIYEMLNESARKRLFNETSIDVISKALTMYVFRDGPVEGMHHNGKLTEEDMKTLNKYMVNKIAGLIRLARDGEWSKIEVMISSLECFVRCWDEAICDVDDIEKIYENTISRMFSR